jgi:hypothetical protein
MHSPNIIIFSYGKSWFIFYNKIFLTSSKLSGGKNVYHTGTVVWLKSSVIVKLACIFIKFL